MNTQLFVITTQEKRDEIKREIAMRQTVYEKRIRENRLSPATAARRIEILQAILKDYDDKP